MDELGPFLDIFRVFWIFWIFWIFWYKYTLRKKSGRTMVTPGALVIVLPVLVLRCIVLLSHKR